MYHSLKCMMYFKIIYNVTGKVATPVIDPIVAIMTLCPALIPVANPLNGLIFEIVAIKVADEDQMAKVVKFIVLPSE